MKMLRLVAWLIFGSALCFLPAVGFADSEMGVVTGGIVDQFRRDDPNGNMQLLKDALEEEVRQRRLSTTAMSPILNQMVPWITHLRDLKGDPASLATSLHLDANLVSARDIETLSRILNLPPAPSESPVLAPAAIAKSPTRGLARAVEKEAEQAFDAFNASLTPVPSPSAADRREWSASGAPRRR